MAASGVPAIVLFRLFENRVPPYPAAEPTVPPAGFLAFVWASTRGLRGYVGAMAALSAVVAIYEALLFAVLGRVVDWIAATAPERFWAERGTLLAGVAAVLVASIGIVALQTTVRHQVLAINFPLRLRWNFHRLMLGQSMAFYADEFAGRITTKIMQTALAVRDMIFTTCDVVIGMGVYLVTILALAGGFEWRLLLPFLAWALCYAAACWYFVPRLGQVSKAQADARSVMTGRVTDAYTNIATVKLFSHTRREAEFARAAMDAFKTTGYAQMRLVSRFEIVNHALVVGMILGACGTALWLWSRGEVGAGAVAAVTAMALRVSGHAHWVMWEMTTLFESVGTIQDGINTLTRPRTVVDAPDARPLQVTRGEVQFENVRFGYRDGAAVIDGLNLTIRPGERIGLIGRVASGKSTLGRLLCGLYDPTAGSYRIDGLESRQYDPHDLRETLRFVGQDAELFSGTVRENLLVGANEANDAAIIEAVKRSGADAFIGRDATGFDFHIGERGSRLSGGQRSFLVLARALVTPAHLLFLDEPTGAMDSQTEQMFVDRLRTAIPAGQTLILATHRMAVLNLVDRLIVMDNGRIVADGPRDEILAQRTLP